MATRNKTRAAAVSAEAKAKSQVSGGAKVSQVKAIKDEVTEIGSQFAALRVDRTAGEGALMIRAARVTYAAVSAGLVQDRATAKFPEATPANPMSLTTYGKALGVASSQAARLKRLGRALEVHQVPVPTVLRQADDPEAFEKETATRVRWTDLTKLVDSDPLAILDGSEPVALADIDRAIVAVKEERKAKRAEKAKEKAAEAAIAAEQETRTPLLEFRDYIAAAFAMVDELPSAEDGKGPREGALVLAENLLRKLQGEEVGKVTDLPDMTEYDEYEEEVPEVTAEEARAGELANAS